MSSARVDLPVPGAPIRRTFEVASAATILMIRAGATINPFAPASASTAVTKSAGSVASPEIAGMVAGVAAEIVSRSATSLTWSRLSSLIAVARVVVEPQVGVEDRLPPEIVVEVEVGPEQRDQGVGVVGDPRGEIDAAGPLNRGSLVEPDGERQRRDPHDLPTLGQNFL